MKLMHRWNLRTLGAAAVITMTFASSFSARASMTGPNGQKLSFLIPVESSLDEKPTHRRSVTPASAPVAAKAPATAVAAAPAASTAAPALPPAQYKQRFLSALDRAIAGDARGALIVLNTLTSQKVSEDERDRLFLAIGRVNYQLGDDAAAVESYKQVRKGGPSWLESLEERSWSLMRMGRPQEALASLRTVMTPIFQDRVYSEPYFLTALAQLRVCDYQSVFKTLDLFKTRFRTRVQGWEASSDLASRTRLRETSDTIQKLNLVEAEAIQRLYIDESGKRMAGAPPKIEKAKDQLTFPMDPETDQKELWLDEVDGYRVTVKGCPAPPSLSVAKKEGSL